MRPNELALTSHASTLLSLPDLQVDDQGSSDPKVRHQGLVQRTRRGEALLNHAHGRDCKSSARFVSTASRDARELGLTRSSRLRVHRYQGEIKATGFNEAVDSFYELLTEGKVRLLFPPVLEASEPSR